MGEFILGAILVGPWAASIIESKGYGAKEVLFGIIASMITAVFVAWVTSLVVRLYLPLVTGAAAYLWCFYKVDPYFSSFVKKAIGK